MSKYIMNTTFQMTDDVVPHFRRWVTEKYIPSAQASNHFGTPTLTRLMVETEPGTSGFAIHLPAEDFEAANQWHDSEAAALKQELFRNLGERIVFFTTFMEVLE